MAKALPWFLAAIYLTAIAVLGQSFSRIDQYKIDQLQRVDDAGALGEEVDLLGLIQILDEYPEVLKLGAHFDSDVSEETMALFIPRLNSDASIMVNGNLVRVARHSDAARHEYHPLLIPFPSQFLTPDSTNELRINLIARGPSMVLSRVYLGPLAVLEPAFDRFFFFRQDLIHGALAATGLLALFILTIWLVRPRFSEYGWLGLAFLAFSYYLFGYVSESVNAPLMTWSFLMARAVFIVAFVLFIHQFLDLKRRWLEYGVGAFFSIVFVYGLVLVQNNQYADFLRLTYYTSLPMVLILIGYVSVVLALALIRSGHVYLHWLLVGAVFGLLLGIHDVLVLLDFQHWLIRDFYISHYSILFTAVGYGGVVVHRIAQALFNSEDLNIELGRLLALKSEALEQSANKRVQQEKEIALYSERQRIMADMHDGVGGQLVGLIAANRSDKLDQAELDSELEHILADLRLVLDALTPAGEELISALARLRERYAGLLRKAGIELHWDISAALDTVELPPSHTVNVLRLVQESIQNVVKHAGARQLSLSLHPLSDDLCLTIQDDGRGFSRMEGKNGHGMTTMRDRALAIGAKLDFIKPEEGGTVVKLTLPKATSPTTDSA